jgi:hypothetical protein
MIENIVPVVIEYLFRLAPLPCFFVFFVFFVVVSIITHTARHRLVSKYLDYLYNPLGLTGKWDMAALKWHYHGRYQNRQLDIFCSLYFGRGLHVTYSSKTDVYLSANTNAYLLARAPLRRYLVFIPTPNYPALRHYDPELDDLAIFTDDEHWGLTFLADSVAREALQNLFFIDDEHYEHWALTILADFVARETLHNLLYGKSMKPRFPGQVQIHANSIWLRVYHRHQVTSPKNITKWIDLLLQLAERVEQLSGSAKQPDDPWANNSQVGDPWFYKYQKRALERLLAVILLILIGILAAVFILPAAF